MRRAGLLICLMLCTGEISAQQELSTFVYTSEEELEEAFINGEIDFAQLITMQELIRFGIDSTNFYLFDEIPNLSYFLKTAAMLQPELKENQKQAFLKKKLQSKYVRGFISHSFSQKLNDEEESRYRTSVKLNLNNSFQSLVRLHREYTGGERIVYRSFRYYPQKSALKSIVVGNFSKRLGLGTVFGYRGKVFDYSRDIDSETFLFPDYGGYNGLNMSFKTRNFSSETVLSHQRDEQFSLSTIAGSLEYLKNKFRPIIVISGSLLKNRVTGQESKLYKYAVGSYSKYNNGYNQTEATLQSAARTSFGAIVTEGRHFFGSAEIKYAGWMYGDDFIDLNSGSKRGNLSETEEIENVNFKYSNKRSGQEGGLFKTNVRLADKTSLINSLVYAGKSEDEYNFEFLSALIKTLSSDLKLRLDFLSKSKSRFGETIITRRSRVELRYQTANVYLRTYLTYNSKTDASDYFSIFANLKYETTEFGRLNIWGNLGRINHNKGRIDYWYAYIENRYEVYENLSVSAKLSHSYRRGTSEPHLSTVSVGLKAQL